MEPLNYAGMQQGIPSFGDSMFKGAQQGMAFQEMRAQNQLTQDKIAAEQLAFQQKQDAQKTLSAFYAKANPSSEDYADVIAKVPGMAEPFEKSWKILNQSQQQQKWQDVSTVVSQLHSGDQQGAIGFLQQQATKYAQQGDREKAEGAAKMAWMVKENPEQALKITTTGMFAFDPAKAQVFLDSLQKGEMFPIQQRKAAAEATSAEVAAGAAPEAAQLGIEKTKSDIEIAKSDAQLRQLEYQLKASNDPLEKQKLQAQIDELNSKKNKREFPPLSPGGLKMVNEFSTESQAAMDSSYQARDVIEKLKVADPYLITRLMPADLRGALGIPYQDVAHQFETLAVKLVQANKPGAGPLSDKDLAFMQKPVPKDSSATKTKVEYLENFAKIQEKVAKWGDVKSQWMTENGNMGKLKQPMQLDDGTTLAAGMTLSDVGKLFRANEIKADEKAKAQSGKPPAKPAGSAASLPPIEVDF